MDSPRLPSPTQAPSYRLPELFQDIRLLDLLELCGTTVQTSRLLRLSQPTISRRYRSLAEDFGLVRDRYQLRGCGYGTSAPMQLLRLACRVHRLAAGVARLGCDMLHHPLLGVCPWLLPTPQRFRSAATWLELVRQGVLDGALLSGLELEVAEGVNLHGLALLPLGGLPLALAVCPGAPLPEGLSGETPRPPVLVPDRGVAPGLRQVLQDLGLTLRGGGNSLRSPSDWIRRIQASSLALVVADREGDSWATLRRIPLASAPVSPVWLALPADWREHPVLRQTARQLGWMDGRSEPHADSPSRQRGLIPSPQAPQADQRSHHHKGDRQGGDAADVPGQASQALVGQGGDQPQAGMEGKGNRAQQQRSFHPHQDPDRMPRFEQPLEPWQENPGHSQASDHLNGQGGEAQGLEGVLVAPDRGSALLPQRPGKHPQIQHQMAPGPDGGGEGMDDHQQGVGRHGRSGDW